MKRKHNQEPLKEVIERLLETYQLNSKLNETRIRTGWEEIVGAAVAKRTGTIYLRGQKLYVEILSDALKQELYYQKAEMANNVNKFLGKLVVTEVEMR